MIATVLFLTALGAGQRAGGSPAGPQQAEMPPPWEAKATIEQVRAKVSRLGEALGNLQVLTWEGAGASNYVAVADSARRQVAGIGGALDRLAIEPQRLSSAIHLFLALQQVTGTLETLSRGVTQFQGAESAHDIEDSTNAVLNEREKLAQYVLAMVQFLETTKAVSERELESCREQLWKRASEPVRSPPKRRR